VVVPPAPSNGSTSTAPVAVPTLPTTPQSPVPTVVPTVAPSVAVSPSTGLTVAGFDLSTVPWWGWAGVAVVAVLAFGGGGNDYPPARYRR